MRPKPVDSNLAKPAIETDSDDGVFWPGDALIKGGQTINKKTIGNVTEETRLPMMKNDGQLNTDGQNAR